MQDIGSFSIDPAHPCLAGHFPGQPVVPGVVILERVRLLLSRAGHGECIHTIHSSKFLAPLYPGQEVAVRIEPDKAARITFVCAHDNEVICKGVLSTG